MRDDLNVSEERIRRIACLLREMYGDPPRRTRGPLDALIATVLSQNTSDVNSERAFATLKSKFPSWADARKADVGELAEAIRVGGLARLKAARIKRVLESVHRDCGRESLDFLRDWDTDRAREYLRSLEGVGPKTAACVLLFGCGRAAFPVDTHVLRVSRRLALVRDRAGAEEAHDIMGRAVPPDLAYALHVNMIAHGRSRCRPRNPSCGTCLLRCECSYWKERALS